MNIQSSDLESTDIIWNIFLDGALQQTLPPP